MKMHVLILLFIFKICSCDWVSEWLIPVQYQYKENSDQNANDTIKKFYEDVASENQYVPQRFIEEKFKAVKPDSFKTINENTSPLTLSTRLEEILKSARDLEATLKREITSVEERERILKEAIANGKYGVTTLIVSTVGRPPRNYLIREGLWTLCNGVVQYPVANEVYNYYTELFSTPRCIGQEVISKSDPCVYNSIIKYETVPTTRRSSYTEDDFLCLKPSFNSTLETYMTVPRRIVDETCQNGTVRSFTNNILDCGIRVLSEYTYYPYRDVRTSALPLEYCTEQDGACKLMVGWHISNKTIENFEFLKNDKKFKKFFIKQIENNVESFL